MVVKVLQFILRSKALQNWFFNNLTKIPYEMLLFKTVYCYQLEAGCNSKWVLWLREILFIMKKMKW